MKKFYDRYQISYFNELNLLDKLKNTSIPFYNFHRIDKYTFVFESSFVSRKQIKKYLPQAQIIKSRGFFSFFNFLILEKVTLISIIVASCFFFFLSSKVWGIKIKGSYQNINNYLEILLEEKGIKKGVSKPNFETLKEIENILYESMEDKIEWLELSLRGSTLYVSYLKRREAPSIEKTKGKIYASKDAVIAKIDISKGNVLVKEDQFVRKGDLIVDDVLISSNNEEIYLGTSGEIYGYTWYIVNVEYQTKLDDKFDIFLEARERGLNQIRDQLSPKEKVIKENVLHYNVNDNIISIRIHFTLYEMIGEEV